MKRIIPLLPKSFWWLLSVVLLLFSHPPFDFGFLAWFALVPVFFVWEETTPRRAFFRGYLYGAAFSLGLFYWFIFMGKNAGIPVFLAALAVLGLVAYLAVYWGIFASVCPLVSRRGMGIKFLVLPSAWVILEFVRDRLFTGFGWASLGATQYKILPIIQIADVTGIFGVSFWVLATNLVVKEIFAAVSLKNSRRQMMACLWPVIAGWFAVTSVILVYGKNVKYRDIVHYGVIASGAEGGAKQSQMSTNRLLRRHAPRNDTRDFKSARSPDIREIKDNDQGYSSSIRVAVIQPNIPQMMKWDPAAWPVIMEKMKGLTRKVVAQNPDLVIWPESSFPGYIIDGEAERWPELKNFVRQLGVPLLFGAVTKTGAEFFNSAILLSAQGEVVAEHRKLHLVPFGEYIPLRRVLPFLSDIIPIGDFSPGTQPTLFPVGPKDAAGQFSVLICFEDTVAPVARQLVRAGAGFLVNITNDAWFSPSAAPALHLETAVFQAVSTRRYLVRAANNGVSATVAPNGQIGFGAVPVDEEGYFVGDISFRAGQTFYARYGDVFVGLCAFCFLTGLLTPRKIKNKGIPKVVSTEPLL